MLAGDVRPLQGLLREAAGRLLAPDQSHAGALEVEVTSPVGVAVTISRTVSHTFCLCWLVVCTVTCYQIDATQVRLKLKWQLQL